MSITYQGAYDLTKQSNYFLQKYGPAAFDIYDSKFEALSQFSKSYDHVGNEFEDLIPSSLGGGIGSGTLPEPSNHQTKRIKFGRKRMYYRSKVNREAIYAGVGDGAFEDTMKVLGARGPLTFSWNIERALWAPYSQASNVVKGSGKLGTITAVANSDPTFTLTCANDWVTARFEIGNLINVETGNTDLFEIQSIDPANTAITVERIGGSQVPAATDEIFMQGSEDNDILGIVSAAEFASGHSIYNQSYGYRWKSTRVNAASAGLTVELMDQTVLEMADMTGVGIDLVMCSSTQWRKLSAQIEDQKRYNVMPKREGIEGALGWKGIEYVHPRGSAPVVISRFIPSDQMFFLNTKYLRMKHAGGFGWFRDTANTIWFPYEEDDALQARFGGYMEAYIPPPFVGQLHTLAT